MDDPELWETVLGWLAQRRLSRGQVWQRLRRRQVEPAVARRLIERLETDGLLDDRAYARDLAEAEVQRGRGPAQIWARLRQRGFDEATIRETWAGLESAVDWRTIAESVATRYDRNDVRDRERLARKLDRMGFRAAIVQAVLEGQRLDEKS
jgi:regulatory protein